MILSVSYVRYRDVRPIWEVILQMTFYASGIFIPIADLEAGHGLRRAGQPRPRADGKPVRRDPRAGTPRVHQPQLPDRGERHRRRRR